jgi:hypothetical protein
MVDLLYHYTRGVRGVQEGNLLSNSFRGSAESIDAADYVDTVPTVEIRKTVQMQS